MGIARAQDSVPIELDLEGNWSESNPNNACADGDPAAITNLLINAIRDQGTPAPKRRPLKLIVSTTAAMAPKYPLLLKAADALAPQLYDEYYANGATSIENDMNKTWLALDKPLVPALSVECRSKDASNGLCSSNIFDDGLKAVAKLASCPGTKFDISNYVIWDEVSIWNNSSIGQTYLAQTANKLIPVDCASTGSKKIAYRQ